MSYKQASLALIGSSAAKTTQTRIAKIRNGKGHPPPSPALAAGAVREQSSVSTLCEVVDTVASLQACTIRCIIVEWGPQLHTFRAIYVSFGM